MQLYLNLIFLQEYILKGVVNAVLGQEMGSVSSILKIAIIHEGQTHMHCISVEIELSTFS